MEGGKKMGEIKRSSSTVEVMILWFCDIRWEELRMGGVLDGRSIVLSMVRAVSEVEE